MIPRQNRVAIMTNLRTHFRRVDASFLSLCLFFRHEISFTLRLYARFNSIQLLYQKFSFISTVNVRIVFQLAMQLCEFETRFTSLLAEQCQQQSYSNDKFCLLCSWPYQRSIFIVLFFRMSFVLYFFLDM